MIKYQINDNELLYLIYEMNDYAFDFLCIKYTPMIKRRIKDFRVSPSYYDDYYQEGLIMLDIAVKTYRADMQKSFNKYFDLIFTRRLVQLTKKENRYLYFVSLIDDIDYLQLDEIEEVPIKSLDLDLKVLSKFEEEIFTKIFYENYRIGDLSKSLNVSERCVYNALSRAKNKIRKTAIETQTGK